MKLGLWSILGVAVAGLGSTLSAQSPEYPLLQLKDHSAIVYDSDGLPLFIADKPFLLGFASNPMGLIYEVDKERRMVRLSTDPQAALWVSCDDLVPETGGCPVSLEDAATLRANRERTRGALNGSAGGLGRGLPNCPGDPRCPKIGGS